MSNPNHTGTAIPGPKGMQLSISESPLKYIGGRNYKEFLQLGKTGRQYPCVYQTIDTDEEGNHWFMTFSSMGFLPIRTEHLGRD